MKISTPYTVHSSEIRLNNNVNVQSGSVSSSNVNVGYYDDTKVWKTIDEIEEQVDGIESSMATKQWVEDKDYVTSGEITAMSYITMDDVSACGYITEHQDLSSYATKNWVEDKHYLTEHQDLSSYATFNDISDMAYVTSTALENASYVTALTDSQMNELFPIEQ